jgi:predicted AAA+ superfamily ATPase
MNHREVVVNWKEFELPSILPRDKKIEIDSDFITTITGPRRAGKTYICFQMIKEIISKGTSRENVIYINFEDNKLLGAEASDLDKILESFLELYDINKKQKIYLFFDEIQVVKNWDSWVRKIHDTRKDIALILTGSSSKMLSREISTKLRGRVINYEIFPLSFKEMAVWKGLEYDAKTLPYSKNKAPIKKLFSAYIFDGGYPGVAVSKLPKEMILQEYYNSMIFKDIVERYKIEDTKRLKTLANLLFESVSKEITYNKLSNKLKSLGFSLSKNTIIEYLSRFEDAYLFFQNLKYDYSLTKQLGSIKKVYCIDNGLLNSVSFKFSDDLGGLLENLAYIDLKRRGEQIYYHRKNFECDFLIVRKNKVCFAIQVTKKLDDDNEKREFSGLLEAMESHGLKEGLILTEDQSEEKIIGGKKIVIKPIWMWLLE